ncbi:hypothetical protein SPBRAN_329 [uncultured Candidatus Thioglobus sp.]|nr:hypothetical protein SPBRAN_329 [uncultured Candidatus Thioglobus sp.]
MKNKTIVFTILILAILTSQANAFWSPATKNLYKIIKIYDNAGTASVKRITYLSGLSSKELGQVLGKLKLSNKALEDTFIRIAIHKKVVTRKEAQQLFSGLSGVPGFRPTLKKIIGNNRHGTKGHLNELKIANNASVAGFKVLGIGQKFKDPAKKALTDIDVVLKKGNRTFIIEAKAYDKTLIDKIHYRKDLATLAVYKKQHRNSDIVPIFTFTNKPQDLAYFKFLNNEAEKQGVKLIFGNPYAQIEQIKMLDKIL